MKNITIFIAFFALLLTVLPAQARGQEDADRVQFKKELREYKHRFIARHLELTKEQEEPFFELYDKMEDETAKITNETRELERKISESGDEVTDLEYDTATDALFELKVKEGDIEKSYLDKFRTVLTKKQLFMLKSVERNFNKELMQHQQRLHGTRKARTDSKQ